MNNAVFIRKTEVSSFQIDGDIFHLRMTNGDEYHVKTVPPQTTRNLLDILISDGYLSISDGNTVEKVISYDSIECVYTGRSGDANIVLESGKEIVVEASHTSTIMSHVYASGKDVILVQLVDAPGASSSSGKEEAESV